MTKSRDVLDELVSTLRQAKDELAVRIHLAGMDAKDEYDRLTNKIQDLSDQYEPVKGAAGKTAENVISALTLAAEEMKVGFSRIRQALKESK